jgi:hypothetical protein
MLPLSTTRHVASFQSADMSAHSIISTIPLQQKFRQGFEGDGAALENF